MKISMYQASAPRFANTLRNLSAILDKARAHCEAKKIDPAVMSGMRLIADMFPLSRQVQIACDSAKGAVARLAGVDIPVHEDSEQRLAELKTRIAKTIDFILSVGPEKIDGSEERAVTLKLGGKELTYTGLQYLLGHAYPNFSSTLPPPTTSCAPTASSSASATTSERREKSGSEPYFFTRVSATGTAGCVRRTPGVRPARDALP